MENIFNGLAESILVINDQGLIKFCNDRLLEKLQYKREDIEDENINSTIDKDGQFTSDTIANLDKNMGGSLACVLYSKSEKRNYYIAHVNIDLWKGERAIFIILKENQAQTNENTHMVDNDDFTKLLYNQVDLLIKNNTLTKKIKIELDKRKESERELALFLDTAIDLVVIIGEDGKYRKVNKGWQKTLGWNEEELLSMNWTDIIYSEDVKSTEEFVEELRKEEKVMTFINRYICKNGNIRWIEWNSRYNLEKRISICTGRDITEKQELEEQKKKYEDAIKLENAKNEFLSNISHEFKTPLNIILATMQLINQNIERGNIQLEQGIDLKRYMNSMKQNCYRLLRLVNNLIDISKIETGFYEIKLENHNIVSVVEDITMSVAEYTKAKGIELIFDTEVEDEIIACDPEKIERIMLNLLSNAVKYTDVNGKIEVYLAIEADKVIISIKDNGEGIPKDKLDLLFSRFMQVDSMLTRRSQGSGIGLALSKSLVEMHGGSIGVTSELGMGTKFEFSLPIELLDTENEYEKGNIHMKDIISSRVERYNIEFSDIYN